MNPRHEVAPAVGAGVLRGQPKLYDTLLEALKFKRHRHFFLKPTETFF